MIQNLQFQPCQRATRLRHAFQRVQRSVVQPPAQAQAPHRWPGAPPHAPAFSARLNVDGGVSPETSKLRNGTAAWALHEGVPKARCMCCLMHVLLRMLAGRGSSPAQPREGSPCDHMSGTMCKFHPCWHTPKACLQTLTACPPRSAASAAWRRTPAACSLRRQPAFASEARPAAARRR